MLVWRPSCIWLLIVQNRMLELKHFLSQSQQGSSDFLIGPMIGREPPWTVYHLIAGSGEHTVGEGFCPEGPACLASQ